MTCRSLLLGVACLATFACSPGPVPVSRSLQDPSNPNAPEGVLPHVAGSVAPPVAPPSAAAAAPAPGASDAGAGVIYVCPMHPEVTSREPGTCPKCNMQLVPKK